MPVVSNKEADGRSWLDKDFKKNALGLAVAGNFAYVADGPFGIQVIDVGNPVHMRHVAHLDIGGYVKEGIRVKGNFLYALRSGWKTSELVVVDVSSPSQPAITGRVQFQGMAWGMDVSGDYAFVGVDKGHVENGGGLAVVDLRVPSRPSVIGWYQCNEALGVQVVGQRAYVAIWEEGVAILDVSNPQKPTEVGRFSSPGAVYSVYVENQTAYVAANQAGLQIFDISNPDKPKRLGSFDPNPTTKREYGVQDVVVKDGLAFVTDEFEGVFVLDVSNPANPVLLAKPGVVPCYGIKLQDHRVYVAAHKNGLLTFEIGGWIQNESGVATAIQPLPLLQISGTYNTSVATSSTVNAQPTFKVAWMSSTGWKYTILTATNDLSSWTPVPDCVNLTGTGDLMTYDVKMILPKQFFRVAAQSN